MPSSTCARLGTSLYTGENPSTTCKELEGRLPLLTAISIQAQRRYATDFSNKEKVAKFHGKKGSDVRLSGLR
jgi:hypothetical protein